MPCFKRFLHEVLEIPEEIAAENVVRVQKVLYKEIQESLEFFFSKLMAKNIPIHTSASNRKKLSSSPKRLITQKQHLCRSFFWRARFYAGKKNIRRDRMRGSVTDSPRI